MVRVPFKPGTLICHFKRDLCSEEERMGQKYVYQVIAYATDTRDLTPLMVYREITEPFNTWARPVPECIEPVDRKKYPDVRQVYRFEYYTVNEIETDIYDRD